MNDQNYTLRSDLPIGIAASGTRRETDSMGEIEVPAEKVADYERLHGMQEGAA